MRRQTDVCNPRRVPAETGLLGGTRLFVFFTFPLRHASKPGLLNQWQAGQPIKRMQRKRQEIPIMVTDIPWQ